MKKYDFIIAGGGMAGLSLAYHLSQSELRDRSVLILDKEIKNQNDRTWCFWEKTPGPFEQIIFRKWDSVDFHGTTLSGPLILDGYQYKMIRGIDFYNFIRLNLQAFPNFEFRQAPISQVKEDSHSGLVIAGEELYGADFIFDSTYALPSDQSENHNLLQHFKGWVISTEKKCFNVNQPKMMDFRVAQVGDCRFIYVLPFNEKTALVEFTVFNKALLAPEDYGDALQGYIDRHLNTGGYVINEMEFGVIPMTDEPTIERPSEHIIRIGTSGGYTKASTGYTFQRTQRYLRDLVQNLAVAGKPSRHRTWFDWRFKLYDSVLLNVLRYNRYPADAFFSRLYERNAPAQVFKFLDEETYLREELKIMSTVPLGAFTIALCDVIRKKLWRRSTRT